LSGEFSVQSEKATFAAGCFWGVEHAFRQIPGVSDAVSGYTDGHLEDPSYQDICSGTTGHAEAVEVTFDPELVSYPKLLEAFWGMHDPTTADRQGPDVGPQYRSAIYFHSPEQEVDAVQSKEATQDNLLDPIVTDIAAAKVFWRAEDYHQRYFEKRGIAVCHT